MKLAKFILGIVAAALFVALFSVPAGDILTGNFLLLKGLNCFALAIVGEVYTVLARREGRNV